MKRNTEPACRAGSVQPTGTSRTRPELAVRYKAVSSSEDTVSRSASPDEHLRVRVAGDSLGRPRSEHSGCFHASSIGPLVVADGTAPCREAAAFARRFVVHSLCKSLWEVDGFATEAATVDRILAALTTASRGLFEQTRQDPALAGAGSAVCLAVRRGTRLLVKAVGNSRAYLVRGSRAIQLTTDQTLRHLLVSSGGLPDSDAGLAHCTDRPLAFLGQHDFVPNDDVQAVSLRAADRVLLCTDGITNSLDATQLGTLIAKSSSPRSAARRILSAAERSGANDGASCALLFADQR